MSIGATENNTGSRAHVVTTDDCSVIRWVRTRCGAERMTRDGNSGTNRLILACIRDVICEGEAAISSRDSASGAYETIVAAVTHLQAVTYMAQDYRIIRCPRPGSVPRWGLHMLMSDGTSECVYDSTDSRQVYRQHARLIGLHAATYYVSRNGLTQHIDLDALDAAAMTCDVRNAVGVTRESLRAATAALTDNGSGDAHHDPAHTCRPLGTLA